MEIVFSNYPDFRPHYTPIQMLNFGIFGGTTFNRTSLRKDMPKEFLQEMVGVDELKTQQSYSLPDINLYSVDAPNRNNIGLPDYIRQSQLGRRGWFHWYIKMYYGNEQDDILNRARIEQWKTEVKSLFQMMQRQGTADAKKLWKQHLLQYSWNNSQTPNF